MIGSFQGSNRIDPRAGGVYDAPRTNECSEMFSFESAFAVDADGSVVFDFDFRDWGVGEDLRTIPSRTARIGEGESRIIGQEFIIDDRSRRPLLGRGRFPLCELRTSPDLMALVRRDLS